jgi:hypothetical protein
MIISELIAALQKEMAARGDIRVALERPEIPEYQDICIWHEPSMNELILSGASRE